MTTPSFAPPFRRHEAFDCSIDPVDFDWRAAVALNNAGVAMMERSCSRQAFEMFKSAAYATKVSYYRNSDIGSGDMQGYDNEVRCKMLSKLQRADRLASRPKPAPLPFPINVYSHDVIHYSTCVNINDKRTAKTGSLDYPLTLIRIETADVEVWDEREPDFLTAIVIYNFGVACCCQSLSSKLSKSGSSCGSDPLIESPKLISFAIDFLAARYANCHNPFIMARVLHISLTMSQALSQVIVFCEEGPAWQVAAPSLESIDKLFQCFACHDHELMDAIESQRSTASAA